MADEQTNPTLTFGENIVGKSFNPSGSSKVAKIKELAAALIDELEVPVGEFSMGQKLFDHTVFTILEAQMLAVKYATLPTPPAPSDDSTDTQADDGGVAAPNEPTPPTNPGGAEAQVPKVAPVDPTAKPAAAGSAAGVANPNARPQTAADSQPETPAPSKNVPFPQNVSVA